MISKTILKGNDYEGEMEGAFVDEFWLMGVYFLSPRILRFLLLREDITFLAGMRIALPQQPQKAK
jgi:hypothetical protein